MKKKFLIYIIVEVIVVCLFGYTKVNIEAGQRLTKNEIFDIIDNVEHVILDTIAKDGNRELSEENKVDFIIKNMIENRLEYKDEILPSESNTITIKGTPLYSFGRVDVKLFNEKLNEYFSEFDGNLELCKFYSNEYIELYYEYAEHFSYSNKEILNIKKCNDIYSIYIRYTREYDEITNDVYVRYDFNLGDKITIKNVKIYGSILS